MVIWSSKMKIMIKEILPILFLSLLTLSDRSLGQRKEDGTFHIPQVYRTGIPATRGGSSGGGHSGRQTSPSSPRGTPSVRRDTVPDRGGSVRAPEGRSRIPPLFGSRSYYSCQRFIDRLCRRYTFFSGREYLWRFDQGDSPLTPDIVKLALRDSLQAATSMVQLTGELEPLLLEFQEGRLDRKSLEQQSDPVLHQVRKLAKSIRKDSVLGYIEQRPRMKVRSREQVRSISELQALAAELHQMALQVRGGITSFCDRDLTRVVSVSDLTQPSLGSISKEIEKLAKTIDKSVDRL